MSRGLRFASTAAMPDGLRAAAERVLQAQPRSRAGRGGAHPSEHDEAVSLMQMVRTHEGAHPALKLLFAVPNGGDRRKAIAGKMRAEGQRAGVPDYVLPVARGPHHGLCIELKSMTGYPSEEQRDWIARLRAEGYRAEVCRGWRAAWAVLCDYLELEIAK